MGKHLDAMKSACVAALSVCFLGLVFAIDDDPVKRAKCKLLCESNINRKDQEPGLLINEGVEWVYKFQHDHLQETNTFKYLTKPEIRKIIDAVNTDADTSRIVCDEIMTVAALAPPFGLGLCSDADLDKIQIH